MPVQAENIATRVYIGVAEQQRQKSQQGHQKKRGRPCKLLGVIHQQRRKELIKSDAARRKAYVLRSQIKSMIR